jgi:outer membrane lipoprotein-sorting protein
MPIRGLWGSALACLIPLAGAAGQDGVAAGLSAAQIVEKNAQARGGREAWRKIDTMVWSGHIETGSPAAPLVPFVFELKRPNKTRFELREDQDKMVRMFDGATGWKVRTPRGGVPALKPYTPAELASARQAQGIDGLLIDYQTKGIDVTLDGSDEVDGRKAYRLVAALPSGSKRHVWVDGETFLELKYDREARTSRGQSGIVTVFYRSWRTIDGLKMPTTIETRGADGKPGETMVIDNVSLNPSLSDARFARPNDLGRHHALPGFQSMGPGAASLPHSGVPRVAPPPAPGAAGSAISDSVPDPSR